MRLRVGVRVRVRIGVRDGVRLGLGLGVRVGGHYRALERGEGHRDGLLRLLAW